MLIQSSQRLDAILASIGLNTDETELADEHLAVYRVIVNHKDARSVLDRSSRYLRQLQISPEQSMERRIGRGGLQDQRRRERRAGSRRALDGDVAIHQLRQAANDRQAKPGATIASGSRTVGLSE